MGILFSFVRFPLSTLSKLRKRLRETVSVASGGLCLHNGRCNCTQVLSAAAREQKFLREQEGQNCRLLFISWNCRRQLWKCSGNLTCLICKGKWWREHFSGHPATHLPSRCHLPLPFRAKWKAASGQNDIDNFGGSSKRDPGSWWLTITC